DRRLSQDRDGHHGRHRGGRPALSRRCDFLRRLHPARSAGGAHRAGTCAHGSGVVSIVTPTPFRASLDLAFGADRVRANAPLAPLTTFKVGGPAEWLVETRGADEIVTALKLAHREGVRVTVL